jgi:hypothetical protein
MILIDLANLAMSQLHLLRENKELGDLHSLRMMILQQKGTSLLI